MFHNWLILLQNQSYLLITYLESILPFSAIKIKFEIFSIYYERIIDSEKIEYLLNHLFLWYQLSIISINAC